MKISEMLKQFKDNLEEQEEKEPEIEFSLNFELPKKEDSENDN